MRFSLSLQVIALGCAASMVVAQDYSYSSSSISSISSNDGPVPTYGETEAAGLATAPVVTISTQPFNGPAPTLSSYSARTTSTTSSSSTSTSTSSSSSSTSSSSSSTSSALSQTAAIGNLAASSPTQVQAGAANAVAASSMMAVAVVACGSLVAFMV